MTAAEVIEDDRYRQMIERLTSGIIVHSEAGDILFANAAAARIAGYDRSADLVGQPIAALLPGPFLRSVRSRLLDEQLPLADRVRAVLNRADAQAIDVEVVEMPHLAGGIACVQIAVSDIGALIAAERDIALAQDRLRILVDQVPGIVWTTDAAGVVDSVRGRLGGSDPPLGLLGRPFVELLEPCDTATAKRAHRAALQGTSSSFEIEQEQRILTVHVEPLTDTSGGIVGTVGLAADVTEFKRAEALRRRGERLDALTRLAGGVAHELNNVLGAILAQAGAVDVDHSTADSLRTDLAAIMNAARRGGTVTANLLGFARGGMYRRDPMSVDDLVLYAALGTRRRAEGRVDVDMGELAPGLKVTGDLPQIRAVLDAVSENAVDATPPGGRITIRSLRADVLDGDPIAVREKLPAGPYGVIEIRDTGEGMSDAVRERACEPYFTTRQGDGRGLGLAMAYGVLRHHGGALVLGSEPGQGTRVSLYFPEGVAAAPRRPAPEPAEARAGRVLVIDDDDMMRMASRRVLERLGYTVVDAADGPAGIAAYAQSRFELVLLDMRMPIMSGDEVLRTLIGADADARVILCTGYDKDDTIRELLALGHVGFVQKPYSPAVLAEEIRLIRRPTRD